MDLLHESMVVPETPLSDSEIRQYITVEMMLLVGNYDFDKFLKKNEFNIDWYIKNEDYRVIKIF